MADINTRPTAGWHDAFAALPPDTPPADGWARLSRRLDARRRPPRWPLPLAAAAVLALAAVPVWLSRQGDTRQLTQAATAVAHEAGAGALGDDGDATTAVVRLQAESARLEALLGYAGDPRVASGTAAVIAAELDAQVAVIDAALMQPGLPPQRQSELWRERVQALRAFAGFESNRRWLAANGERYDGALARVD